MNYPFTMQLKCYYGNSVLKVILRYSALIGNSKFQLKPGYVEHDSCGGKDLYTLPGFQVKSHTASSQSAQPQNIIRFCYDIYWWK